eukprot:1184652-Prorocentrum_minimum.AAC.1
MDYYPMEEDRAGRPKRYTRSIISGYDAGVKGYRVDVKGYDADVKGYCVDVKGYDADVKG